MRCPTFKPEVGAEATALKATKAERVMLMFVSQNRCNRINTSSKVETRLKVPRVGPRA